MSCASSTQTAGWACSPPADTSTSRPRATARSAPIRRPSMTAGTASPHGPARPSPGSRIEEIRPVIDERLQAPVPRPRQVFAIGVNYRDHAAESGIDLPAEPMVFTKYPSAITGPYGTIALPRGSVDFEAELVAVIGPPAYRVPESGAWSYVAGLTIGQDLSERETQL